MNKVIMLGRLVADPELRRTQSGTAVGSGRIAVDRDRKKNDTGEKESDFFDLVAWRSTGEFLSKYFHKGDQILLVGKIQNRSYTTKDGQKRISAEIIADELHFTSIKKNGSEQNVERQAVYQQMDTSGVSEQAIDNMPFSELEDDDDELPW